MLKALTELFAKTLNGDDAAPPPPREHMLRFATAILLVEIARADYSEEFAEELTILRLLEDFFDLTDEESALLVEEAKAEADHAASLQAFTRQLHESLSPEEKLGIIEMLWKVALADDHLDKHEDHLVRKIAGLLYVSHSDLIRIRNRVDPSHS